MEVTLERDIGVQIAAAQDQRARSALEQDWGFLYGFGLFETLRTYSGVPFLLDQHVERLFISAEFLGITIPFDQQTVAAHVRRYSCELGDRIIRFTLTAGNPDLGLPPQLLLSDRPVSYTYADRVSGVAVTFAMTVRDERSPFVRHKTLGQLQNLIEWRRARGSGYAETLFLNAAGHIAEGARSNVFFVRGGEVLTPADTCGLLSGITRRFIIQALSSAGVSVCETLITSKDLHSCDECFLTSSGMEVMPVSRIDHWRPAHLGPGAVTRLAAAEYQEAVGRATLPPARGNRPHATR